MVPKKVKSFASLPTKVLKSSMALHTAYTKENTVKVTEVAGSRVSQI